MGGGNPLKKIEEEASGIGDVFLPGLSSQGRVLAAGAQDPFSAADVLIPGYSLQGRAATGSLDEAFGGALGNQKAPEQSAGANDLAAISKALFAETDPLRRSLIGRSEGFLSGGLDVTQSPMYGALKQGAEDQFGRAQKNILATTPTGGGLTEALAANEMQKARALTLGTGDIAGQELARATALATGQPLNAAVSGLGSAGSIQAQQAQAQATENAATKQALGAGAGAVAFK